MPKNTSILLLTYRKHEFLTEILAEISKYKPSKLYIFQNKEKDEHEVAMIQKVQSEIYNFDYKFEIEIKVHQTHLPISKSYYAAMDYVFSKEDRIIVLEDDVIPNISFFHFCNLMLEKYKNSSEIGCINGCNLNAVNIPNGYFLSGMSTPYWGWATWKDKWSLYRVDNYYWVNYEKRILSLISKENRPYFKSVFDSNSNDLNVWDLQWNTSLLANNLKTIIPTMNLITNKGFVENALTTLNKHSIYSNLKRHDINRDLSFWDDMNIVKTYEYNIKNLFSEITNIPNRNLRERIKGLI